MPISASCAHTSRLQPSSVSIDLVAGLDVVGARQHLAGDVAQQVLLVGQVEVHDVLTVPESWRR